MARSERERLLQDLWEAREDGDEHTVALTLYRLSMITPLFADNIAEVREWVREARDLAVRSVLHPRQEVGQVLRSAEIFVAVGLHREGFRLAHEACALAERAKLPAFEDRAWMVAARALVRLGQQDDAVTRFEKIVARESEPKDKDPLVPGLAFLAVGEAHLFEGRYDGAYGPLERAVALLPEIDEAARLRYDALVGLGMLDHRAGVFDSAALRYEAAMKVADAHSSKPEQVQALLLLGSLARAQGQTQEAHSALARALKISGGLTGHGARLAFPTERLRQMSGHGTVEGAIEQAMFLARDCGSIGDLMGYVQLTAITTALIDLDGRNGEAREMLTEVAAGLDEGGQSHAAEVLRKHLAGYS